MSEIFNYTTHEVLKDGSQIEIRALRRTDESDMLAAIEKPVRNRCSAVSLS